MSRELRDGLEELGLARYVPLLFNAGYSDWDAVADLTEHDFEALGILLGDRRKLQREIARRQLWPDGSPLPTPDELREFTASRDGEDQKSWGHYFASSAEERNADMNVSDNSTLGTTGDKEAAERDNSTQEMAQAQSFHDESFQADADMPDVVEEHFASQEEVNHLYDYASQKDPTPRNGDAGYSTRK